MPFHPLGSAFHNNTTHDSIPFHPSQLRISNLAMAFYWRVPSSAAGWSMARSEKTKCVMFLVAEIEDIIFFQRFVSCFFTMAFWAYSWGWGSFLKNIIQQIIWELSYANFNIHWPLQRALESHLCSGRRMFTLNQYGSEGNHKHSPTWKCICQVMEMQVAGRIPHRYPSLSKRISCVLATHPSHEMKHQTVAAEHPVMLSTNGIPNGIPNGIHGVSPCSNLRDDVRYSTQLTRFLGRLKYTMMSLRNLEL